MKKKITTFMFIIFCFAISNIYATTQFSVNRKAIKIYDKFNLMDILTTDSDKLQFSSSDEETVSVLENGTVISHKQGQAIITVSDGESSDTLILSSGYYTGIDISSYNGTVDWQKVKEEGIDFVMIRAGYGWYDEADVAAGLPFTSQVDTQLLNNLEGATSMNIPFGLYHVSYADTLEKADKEADYILDIINEYSSEYKEKIALPIAYDVEVSKLQSVGKAELTNIVIHFCTRLYEAGYVPIVYSYRNFINNYLDVDKINAMAYNIWYAYYGSGNDGNIDYSSKIILDNTDIVPFMWQYTSKGSIDGANTSSGYVDLNLMYMKDRVKIDVVQDGEIIDTIGADKGEILENYPELAKEGYTLSGFSDISGKTIDNNYIFNMDTTIYANFKKIPITQITLNYDKIETEFSAEKQEEYNLSVISYLPEEAVLESGDILYKSDNNSIATVDENGNVVITGIGECNIIAYLKDNEQITSTCSVIVNYNAVKGDMNEDGYINSTDASLVLDRYKNNDATSIDFELGDMNEDGYLNSTDASIILDIFKNS